MVLEIMQTSAWPYTPVMRVLIWEREFLDFDPRIIYLINKRQLLEKNQENKSSSTVWNPSAIWNLDY